MRRHIRTIATLGFLLGLGVGPAAAQGPYPNPIRPPVTPPPVSPYLNLFRQGSSPGINYYDLVRPQIEFRNNYQRLQQDFNAAEQQQASAPDETSGLPPTGHTAQFNTQGRFFMTRGASAPGYTNPSGGGSFRPATAPPRIPNVPGRPPGM